MTAYNCHEHGHPTEPHHHLAVPAEASPFQPRTSPHDLDHCSGSPCGEFFMQDPRRILVIRVESAEDLGRIRNIIHATGIVTTDIPFSDISPAVLPGNRENFAKLNDLLDGLLRIAKEKQVQGTTEFGAWSRRSRS